MVRKPLSVGLFFLLSAYCSANQTLINLPADTWYAAPNTKMQAVTPAQGDFAGTWGIVGPRSVIIAWGGAALDTKRDRLILWGGGHADYYGNELYAFDVQTLTWERLTDPFVNPVLDQEVNADGTPNSRHTYGGLAYLDHADRFFGLGGSLAGSGFATCNRTWVYDFDADHWTNRSPAVTPRVGYDCYCAYNPESSLLYWQGGGSWGGLWTYNYDTNTWAKHNDDNFPSLANAVDTKRGLLFSIGNSGQATGGVCVYDIRNSNFTRDTWTTTGGDAFIAKGASGLAYDPVADKIVGWNGGAVYALDPDTKVWTAHNASGAPTATGQGMYGRWRYVPSANAFICVTDWNVDVHFFKLTAGGGTGKEAKAEAKEYGRITVSPNPAKGMVNINYELQITNYELEDINIAIYDIHGRCIKDLTNEIHNSSFVNCNLSGLPAGVYLVRTAIGNRTLQKKIVLVK